MFQDDYIQHLQCLALGKQHADIEECQKTEQFKLRCFARLINKVSKL